MRKTIQECEAIRRLLRLCFALVVLVSGTSCRAAEGVNHLAGNTVLIIRHAEKPAEGTGLNAAGEARAQAYAKYFAPFAEGDYRFRVDALYAGADSESSYRPRLTLEPLSRSSGMKLDLRVGTKDPERLVTELREEAHGQHPLIVWRHGQIPALLRALGASPDKLLPDATWPDDVYDWIIVLQFDKSGRLEKQARLTESLHVSQKETK